MGHHALLELVEKQHLKAQVPEFHIGDSVDVHTRIVEGDKERIQVFSGVVIGRRSRGINESFAVRRLVGNEGVERTFLIHSPNVVDVKVKRRGRVRRAKLYYLRERLGKARKLRELRLGQKKTGTPQEQGELATAGV
jgi:large subunit ribosomal protein L19